MLSATARFAKAPMRVQIACLRNRQTSLKRFQTTVSMPSDAMPNKPVAYWLFGVAALVAGMVTVGGVTRLTRSGLSMTDWKLQGSLPPMTKEEWEKEFARYKTFPEWQQRQSMTVEEFKFIYFWEYGHRMLGRFVGIAFTVPAIYFAARGMIPRAMYPRMGLLFALGGGQGLIGWWMVKSGLDVDPTTKKEIRVSPYRLATHLSMAFVTYGVLVWTGMDMLYPKGRLENIASTLSKEALQFAKKSRRFAWHNVALVAATVLTGAFVAGNDAGRAFNTFPKMGDEWIPSEILEMTPTWRNFFENTATVQFDHRIMALSALTAIGVGQYSAKRALQGQYMKVIPALTRTLYFSVSGMAITQVALGISTLLMHVPIPLAAVHQAGSLVLLTLLTALTHSLGFSKMIAKSSGAASVVPEAATASSVGAKRAFSTVATSKAVQRAVATSQRFAEQGIVKK